ncbi:MAG: hypothetical protein ACRETQ_03285, partial [Gammaproteobacteria bacterium]
MKRQREELKKQSVRGQLAEETSHRTIEQLQKHVNSEHAQRIKAETQVAAQKEFIQTLKAMNRNRVTKKLPSHRTKRSPSLTLVHSRR